MKTPTRLAALLMLASTLSACAGMPTYQPPTGGETSEVEFHFTNPLGNSIERLAGGDCQRGEKVAEYLRSDMTHTTRVVRGEPITLRMRSHIETEMVTIRQSRKTTCTVNFDLVPSAERYVLRLKAGDGGCALQGVKMQQGLKPASALEDITRHACPPGSDD